MTITPRHFRLAALVGIAWIGCESLLFWLAAHQIGVLPVLAFITLKGFAGFALFATHLRSLFRGAALRPLQKGLSGLGSAGISALGAFLIFLPGMVLTLLGLALFAPSVRGAILRWAKREKRRSRRDEIVTLDAREWRDLGVVRPSRRKRTAVAAKPRDISP